MARLFDKIKKDVKKELGKAYMQLEDLYGKCVGSGDFRVALECLKTKMDFFDPTGSKGSGAGATTKGHIIGNQTNVQNNFQLNLAGMNTEEKRVLLKAMRKKGADTITT